jgi:hypothetical protein
MDSTIVDAKQVRQDILDDATYMMSASNHSIFYDIGSGYGKIGWHAAFQFQVRSLGSEIHAGRNEFA